MDKKELAELKELDMTALLTKLLTIKKQHLKQVIMKIFKIKL